MQSCPYCEFTSIPAAATICPRCGTELSDRRPAKREVPVTLAQPIVGKDLPLQAPPKQANRTATGGAARTFRPVRRPPMALVCLYDDGLRTGEWFRVRTPCVAIGRDGCDINVPHDVMLSARHAEICCELCDGEYRWFFRDLDSTNGSFAKISRCLLRHNQELLLGCRRYRFEAAPRLAQLQQPTMVLSAAENRKMTCMWQTVSLDDTEGPPALVELLADGDGPRLPLTDGDNWIGTDASSTMVTVRDPYVEPRHARVYRDELDRWQIESLENANGTWLRIDEIEIVAEGEFQVGEQRLLVKML